MCVVEWKYGINVVLVNGYMEVLCVLVNGHMDVMWCWLMDIWRYKSVLLNGHMEVLCVLVNGYMEELCVLVN